MKRLTPSEVLRMVHQYDPEAHLSKQDLQDLTDKLNLQYDREQQDKAIHKLMVKLGFRKR